MNLGELRENYTQNGLRTFEMEADPFLPFEKWIIQAQEAQIIEPNAIGSRRAIPPATFPAAPFS
jgi:pyridoxine/pyridoxamine 5'-phosphate oxidase